MAEASIMRILITTVKMKRWHNKIEFFFSKKMDWEKYSLKELAELLANKDTEEKAWKYLAEILCYIPLTEEIIDLLKP